MLWITDCREESESALELLWLCAGDGTPLDDLVISFRADGERALSLEEVRSFRTWPSPLLNSDCDDVFLGRTTSDIDLEIARGLGRGIRLRDALHVLELSDINGLPLVREVGGESLGCETQSSDKVSTQRSMVS